MELFFPLFAFRVLSNPNLSSTNPRSTMGPRIMTTTGQITIIPKPELRGFWGDSLTKPPFGVTSAEVAIICPDYYSLFNEKMSRHGPGSS